MMINPYQKITKTDRIGGYPIPGRIFDERPFGWLLDNPSTYAESYFKTHPLTPADCFKWEEMPAPRYEGRINDYDSLTAQLQLGEISMKEYLIAIKDL
jgi:hypothetical protein